MASFEELGFKVVKTGRYSSICPFCSHLRKPENRKVQCATINNEAGNRWYNCSNCGAKGNIDLREKYDAIYKEAKMPKERPKLFPDDVQSFLDFKQISAATALKLGVYTRPAPGKRNLICYPYYFRHTLRNVMFRKPQSEKGDSGPREWQIKKEFGTESVFWGLDDLNFDNSFGPAYKNEIIITEGQTDRMTWYECGYENILSLPDGGLNPKAKADGDKLAFLSKDFLELTKGVERFILATDNDEVGRYTEAVLAQKLGPERCFRLNYPYGYKDSNEVYAGDAKKNLDPKRKTGIDELYKGASAYPIAGIIRLRDIRNEVKILAQEGLNRGFMTGMKPWDNHLSVRSKVMMVVTGIPGMGKSSFSRDLLVKLSEKNDDLRWGMYTPESRPMKREYLKLIENYGRRPSNPKYKLSLTPEQYRASEMWVDNHFILVAPEKKDFYSFSRKDAKPKTLDNLFDYFKALKRNEGIFGVVIDAWNKVDHQRPSGMNETDFISRELDRVLEFLDVHDLFGVIVAHPAKQERGLGGNYALPGLYDIKGSSAWSEKADIGIVIHRVKNKDKNEGLKGMKPFWVKDRFAPTICSIEKMKFDELGVEGEFNTYMDWRKGDRFYAEKSQWMVEIENKGEDEKDKDVIAERKGEENPEADVPNLFSADDIPF